VDTTFHAIHPAYFWGQSHGALEKTNSHHYEQQGHYTGEVRIGTERYKIDGVGVHDHAWGWGARAGIRRWIWASAQFSSRLAVNTFLVTLADGREIVYGYIWRGKQNELIRRSMLKGEYAPKGQAPAALALTMEGRNGDRVSANPRVLNAFNTSFQKRNKTGYHYFCAAEFQEHRPENWTTSQE
jgi:hypothetical protein